MAKKPTAGKSAKKTPDNWDQFKDGRKNKGAGTYPNAWRRKTRSGHLIEIDDSKDAEHITIQHRGGGMIQFLPDGAVHYTSFNGQHNIVFGENRIYVSGSQDITCEGDSSTKIKGDNNQTTEGGQYVAVNGPSVVVAKSQSAFYKEHNDTVSKSSAMQVTENMSIKAGKAITMAASEGFVGGSDQSGVALSGMTAGMHGEQGLALQTGGTLHGQAQQVAFDATEIHFNSGKSKPVKSVVKLGNPSSDVVA